MSCLEVLPATRVQVLAHLRELRERAAPDQRVVRGYLTADGERLVRRAPKPAAGAIHVALAHLPTVALTRLARDLVLVLRAAASRQ